MFGVLFSWVAMAQTSQPMSAPTSAPVIAVESVKPSEKSFAIQDGDASQRADEAGEGPGVRLPFAGLPELTLRPISLLESNFEAHPIEFEGRTGFTFSRARLGFEMAPLKSTRLVLIAEFARGAPRILDAFVRVGVRKGMALSFGFNKTPLFSSFKSERADSLPIPELSITTRSLSPARDGGVELQLFPERAPLEAWFRVGNGSQSFAGNDNLKLSFDGRLDVVLGRVSRWKSREEFFGLRLGGGYHQEETPDRLGVEASSATGFVFFRPVTVSGLRQVAEVHALLQMGPVQMLAEGGWASEGRSRDNDGNPNTPREELEPIESLGGAFEVAWMITGEHRLTGAWPIEKANKKFGAFEVAGRVERLNLSTAASDVAAGGATSGAASLRWWYNSLMGFGISAQVLASDVAPLETPGRTNTWLALARATFSLR